MPLSSGPLSSAHLFYPAARLFFLASPPPSRLSSLLRLLSFSPSSVAHPIIPSAIPHLVLTRVSRSSLAIGLRRIPRPRLDSTARSHSPPLPGPLYKGTGNKKPRDEKKSQPGSTWNKKEDGEKELHAQWLQSCMPCCLAAYLSLLHSRVRPRSFALPETLTR
ncbi:hypothetical protein CDD83_3853 [Cordyceps sp. RAO-2017]|nr:hypothetical protein CDD83_3853 [Cordyceps sp. RAO-2017]